LTVTAYPFILNFTIAKWSHYHTQCCASVVDESETVINNAELIQWIAYSN